MKKISAKNSVRKTLFTCEKSKIKPNKRMKTLMGEIDDKNKMDKLNLYPKDNLYKVIKEMFDTRSVTQKYATLTSRRYIEHIISEINKIDVKKFVVEKLQGYEDVIKAAKPSTINLSKKGRFIAKVIYNNAEDLNHKVSYLCNVVAKKFQSHVEGLINKTFGGNMTVREDESFVVDGDKELSPSEKEIGKVMSEALVGELKGRITIPSKKVRSRAKRRVGK